MRNLISLLQGHAKDPGQRHPLLGEAQIPNNAGGFVYSAGSWKQFERFLILGSESGTFYVSASDLTIDAAQSAVACLQRDPKRAVELITSISTNGRAPSNRQAIFAMALAFCVPSAVPYAKRALPLVARTSTHLFEFLTAVRGLRGFGRALRSTVARWYLDKNVDALGYQVVKYRARSGWTHRDALRVAHPRTTDPARQNLLAWATGGSVDRVALPEVVRGLELAQSAQADSLPELITRHRLTHEMVPSGALKDPAVLSALARDMPLGALLRFLGRFAAAGMFRGRDGVKFAGALASRFRDRKAIRSARLHPLGLLVAQLTFAQGHGRLGKLVWKPDKRIIAALEDAFQLAFDNVTPSGKRILIAVDVSGSMGWSSCSGAPALTCAQGAAALALVAARTERNVVLKAFSSTFKDLPVTPRDTVKSAVHRVGRMAFGSTDCALPMTWALQHHREFDAFIVITDNETWCGNTHPMTALRRYRKAMVPDARLVVMAMTPTEFSIADPADPRTLDVCGFDTATPQLVTDFVAGRLV